MAKNRVLICTFIALTSGFFAGFAGWQISMSIKSQKCQNQVWGVREICTAAVAPGAMWSGSTTGLWTGTILGAYIGGLVTKKK
jgi:hypothetical protein